MMSESIVARYKEAAIADMIQNNRTEIKCPCRKCKLRNLLRPESRELEDHLLMNGFMPGHTQWIAPDPPQQDNNGDRGGREDEQPDPEHDEGHDGEGDAEHDGEEDAGADDHDADQDAGADEPSSTWVRDPHVQELIQKPTSNARAATREKVKLAQLEKDADTPLYRGCRAQDTRLKTTLAAMEMKVRHKMTDACFDEHMEFWSDRLPEGNTLPTSIEEAKKVVCPLDLPHVRYHACINDCIIYRGEDAERTTCPVCGQERYKRGTKKAPRKVVWYFPITPRLQRYFVEPHDAKLMRWHAERNRPAYDENDPDADIILTHPSDANQWKALDDEYPFFEDPRNIRLGMSTDGLNPFGNQSSTHSTWPVFVWPYNLPPWLCTKRKYIQISMVIQGPKQPGIDISMYLGLLKEELAMLWETPARTYDAVAQDYFPMRAALITTVQDYPGYGYVAGQVNHGHYACVKCMDDTPHHQLQKDPGSSKTVYTGHRRWLDMDDPWRKRKDLFDGTEEMRGPPCPRTGAVIDELLKNWKECPLPGKKKGKAPEALLKIWKTVSPFWGLPYWRILRVPHSLDVMHIIKNVCESLLATLLNMPDKTKDGPKARSDLKHMGIRKDLHGGRPNEDQDEDEDEDADETEGRRLRKKAKKNHDYYCPPSCFTLSPNELKKFIECLLGVKFPNGYAGKISRYLDAVKQRFSGMKSHDCHVLMTQILPVAIRGIMDPHVRETLFGLCNFFDVITRKSVGVRQLERLQEEIMVILCELEMYFPPAFFDIMVHLLVHIVDDIIQLGPTFLHYMMPFERMNGHIKGYVRSRSHPDACITKGYLTEECISFCTSYLQSETPVGLPSYNRHLGRLAGWGHREGSRHLQVDFAGRLADFDRANLVALQHLQVVDRWCQTTKNVPRQKLEG